MMYIFFLANIDTKISTAPSAKLLIIIELVYSISGHFDIILH